jgi:copper(I)-binding protein
MFGIKEWAGGFTRVGASSAHAQQLWFAPVVYLSVFILWLLFGMGCSDRDSSSVIVKNAWVRQNIPPQTMTAAYLSVHNQGTATALISASTPAAEVAEIHVMTTDGNIMRMRKIDRLPIPENGSATLQPGGNHLMLIGLRRDLAPGDSLALTLTFANGYAQTFRAPVISIQNEGLWRR